MKESSILLYETIADLTQGQLQLHRMGGREPPTDADGSRAPGEAESGGSLVDVLRQALDNFPLGLRRMTSRHLAGKVVGGAAEAGVIGPEGHLNLCSAALAPRPCGSALRPLLDRHRQIGALLLVANDR